MLIAALSVSLLVHAAAPSTFSVEDATKGQLTRLDRQIDQLCGLLHIPGLSAVVLKDQKVIFAKGYGYADIETHRRVTPDTAFHVASLTKTFTSTLLMRLVEEGKLGLDEPMVRYVPEIKDERIEVKHLLSHTSSSPPGERYLYNGSQYAFLGTVIEKKAGKPLWEVVTGTFLDPLQMTNTVPGRAVVSKAALPPDVDKRYRSILAKSALPYRLYGEETVRTGFGYGDLSASAGLVSTALDIAKYDAAIDRNVYLKKETQELAWTPFVSNTGRALPHGLGWFSQSFLGQRVIWHYGYDPDCFSATYVKVPGKGITMILLANCDALSAPYARIGVMKASPFVIDFLRIFAADLAPSDPNWTLDKASFSAQIAALGKGASYGYTDEAISYDATRRWLDLKRTRARVAAAATPDLYSRYVGRYAMPDGAVLIVTQEGKRLMLDTPNGLKSELFPEGATRYFLKSVDAELTFVVDESGKAVRIDLLQNGQTTPAKRIQ